MDDKNHTDEELREDSGRDRGKENGDEFEKVCFMCRRTESQAGKMISLPGGISVCADCMQKSFDAMDNPEIRNMLNLPHQKKRCR